MHVVPAIVVDGAVPAVLLHGAVAVALQASVHGEPRAGDADAGRDPSINDAGAVKLHARRRAELTPLGSAAPDPKPIELVPTVALAGPVGLDHVQLGQMVRAAFIRPLLVFREEPVDVVAPFVAPAQHKGLAENVRGGGRADAEVAEPRVDLPLTVPLAKALALGEKDAATIRLVRTRDRLGQILRQSESVRRPQAVSSVALPLGSPHPKRVDRADGRVVVAVHGDGARRVDGVRAGCGLVGAAARRLDRTAQRHLPQLRRGGALFRAPVKRADAVGLRVCIVRHVGDALGRVLVDRDVAIIFVGRERSDAPDRVASPVVARRERQGRRRRARRDRAARHGGAAVVIVTRRLERRFERDRPAGNRRRWHVPDQPCWRRRRQRGWARWRHARWGRTRWPRASCRQAHCPHFARLPPWVWLRALDEPWAAGLGAGVVAIVAVLIARRAGWQGGIVRRRRRRAWWGRTWRPRASRREAHCARFARLAPRIWLDAFHEPGAAFAWRGVPFVGTILQARRAGWRGGLVWRWRAGHRRRWWGWTWRPVATRVKADRAGLARVAARVRLDALDQSAAACRGRGAALRLSVVDWAPAVLAVRRARN